MAEAGNQSEFGLNEPEPDGTASATRDWLDRLADDEPVTGVTAEEMVKLIHEGRAERDEQILRALRW